MTRPSTEALIADLAADARPIAPLRSPGRRALLTLTAIASVGLLAISVSDARGHLTGAPDADRWLGLGMAAILATGLLALTGAFFAAVPGRSRLWLAAPLPFLAAWLLVSAAACYADLSAGGMGRWRIGGSWHCLLFVVVASLGIAAPVTWLLARAAPIEAVRVALLTGLGTSALATFLLHFFHPFDATAGDIAVHGAAIALVTGLVVALRRQALGPA